MAASTTRLERCGTWSKTIWSNWCPCLPWNRQSSDEPDALDDERVKVLKATKTLSPKEIVRGQYSGYLDEPGVESNSDTETFFAARLEIDSWRWAGVPWIVRAGKGLASTVTEGRCRIQPATSHVVCRSRLGARGQPDRIQEQARGSGDPVDASEATGTRNGERVGRLRPRTRRPRTGERSLLPPHRGRPPGRLFPVRERGRCHGIVADRPTRTRRSPQGRDLPDGRMGAARSRLVARQRLGVDYERGVLTGRLFLMLVFCGPAQWSPATGWTSR